MQKSQTIQTPDNNLAVLSLTVLREKWAECWHKPPHERIGRAMLEKSLTFKLRQIRGEGLSAEQQKRLDHLVAAYRRNPEFFAEDRDGLKPGVRLVRHYKGQHHSVTVKSSGFEYHDKLYGSLSEIALIITGTKWNGWVFFGLKKRGGRK